MLLKMERPKILMMVLIAAFLAMISKSNSQFRSAPVPAPAFPAIRPLCLSQFALVNYACSMLPYSPVSPSTPASPPSPTSVAESPCPPKSTTSHQHRHHHRHRHSSNGSHTSMAEEECCRWLKEVDTKCVCDLLVRLPPFLAKPGHDYKVNVNDDCSVTYSCPGRVIF